MRHFIFNCKSLEQNKNGTNSLYLMVSARISRGLLTLIHQKHTPKIIINENPHHMVTIIRESQFAFLITVMRILFKGICFPCLQQKLI